MNEIMKRVSANEAKQRFGEVLDAAQRAPVIIERHGRPRAIVLSYDDFAEAERQKLEALRRDIQVGLDDIKAGRMSVFDPEKIKRNGRKKALRRA
jgi:prevent-host-death family protein